MDEAWLKELAERHKLDGSLIQALRSIADGDQDPAEGIELSSSHTTIDLGEDLGSPRTQGPIRLGRYDQLGLIGEGGMGEVFRVLDPGLSRVMALKALRAPLARKPAQLTRFLEEAQVTAQLRHPGVVAVHEFGRLEDGRVYFTMEEIQGKTLAAIILELHGASDRQRWGTTDSGWTLHKVVEAFRRACETMAYSHARGVIHRDLKPSNLMLGDYGEVLVLDWGLAKVTGYSDSALDPRERVVTERMGKPDQQTRLGKVFGTPAYMPPEQARGAWTEVGPAADVYSLGAVLYKILAGRSPYRATGAQDVLQQVLAGPPIPLDQARMRAPIPVGLQEICARAMARVPKERYADGGALAEAVSAWLDGSMRRERALVRVAEAQELEPQMQELRWRAKELRAGAIALLEPVRGHEPVSAKQAGWALEDQAVSAQAQAGLLELDARRALHEALNLAPDLSAAHSALARLYRARQVEAESQRDWQQARQWERLLRDHGRGEHQSFLAGMGRLTLQTEVPAEAVLYQYVERGRRLRPERVRSLGQTPLQGLELAMGDYVVVLHSPGRVSVRYPVCVQREGHWDGVSPSGESTVLALPLVDELGVGECYVPAGWFTAGGDPLAPSALPRTRVWVRSFVIQQQPVTNQEYCAFLNGLVDGGLGELAEGYAPRFEGFQLLSRREDRFACRTDLSMFDASLDKPVVLISWDAAKAYAQWYSERTGQQWRLPFELEWEKSARGVDARCFPWGRFLDPTWCNMRESQPERPALVAGAGFPADESPYGVQGLAGNAMDWCADHYREVGPKVVDGVAQIEPEEGRGPRALRGGHFHGVGEISRAAHRYRLDPGYLGTMIGFRLARSV